MFRKLLYSIFRKPEKEKCINCAHSVNAIPKEKKIRCMGLYYQQLKPYDFSCHDFLDRGDQGV